jgi:hypothetical protein
MSDTITFGADASAYFDVVARMQSKLDGLEGHFASAGRGGDHIGEGFLRSERIVSRSSANMVASLLQVNSAGDAVAAVLQNVERASKLGLGLAVGVGVGIAIFEAVKHQLDATDKAYTALQGDLDKPIDLILNLAPEDIGKEIESTKKHVEELKAASSSISNQGLKGFQALGVMLDESATLQPQLAAEGRDSNQIAIEEGERKITAEMHAQIDAQSRMIDLKAESMQGSSEQAALDKAALEYTQQKAKLDLEVSAPGGDGTGYNQRVDNLERTRDMAIDEAKKKALIAYGDNQSATDVANFRGTDREKKDFSLGEALANAKNHKEIMDEKGTEEEQDKANLEVDQAQMAIDKERLAVQSQLADLAHAGRISDIKVGAARNAVGLGPEAGQGAALDTQVALAKEGVQTAREKLALDTGDVSAQKALNSAIAEQAIAEATKSKFQNDKAFAHTQELTAAQAVTAEMDAQSKGQSFLAGLLKTREAAEAKIAGYLRDQKNDMAGQAALQGKMGIRDQLAKRLDETPEQRRTRESEERHQAHATSRADAAINDAADRERRGARLDESNPVTQALRAQQKIDENPLADGNAGPNGDFSSVSSLAGQDFSSLASLASMDFAGLAGLSGLTIAIA